MFEAHSWANEFANCQSNLSNSLGYERLQKSKDSLNVCFENVSITLNTDAVL